MSKPLFTSPILHDEGYFWRSESIRYRGEMSLCAKVMRQLWDLPKGYPIQVGLARTRVRGSYKIMDLDDDAIRIEGQNRNEFLLVNITTLDKVRRLMDRGPVYVYVDIHED